MLVDIIVQGDDGQARQERLDAKGQVKLGRHTECTIVLDGDLVSRHHANLVFGLEAFRIEDVSSNGTIVGDRVLRREAMDAPYGTPLVFGNHTVQIFPALSGVSVEGPAVKIPRASDVPHRDVASREGGLRDSTVRDGGSRDTTQREGAGRSTAPAMRATPQPKPNVIADRPRPPSYGARDVVRVGSPSAISGETTNVSFMGRPSPAERWFFEEDVVEVLVRDGEGPYVLRNGTHQLSDERFADDAAIVQCITKLLARARTRVERTPGFVEAILDSGARLVASLPPCSKRPGFVFRRRVETTLTADSLVESGAISRGAFQLLWRALLADVTIVFLAAEPELASPWAWTLAEHGASNDRWAVVGRWPHRGALGPGTTCVVVPSGDIVAWTEAVARAHALGAERLLIEADADRPQRMSPAGCRRLSQAMASVSTPAVLSVVSHTSAEAFAGRDRPVLVATCGARDGSPCVESVWEASQSGRRSRARELYARQAGRLSPSGRLPSFLDALAERGLIPKDELLFVFD